MGTTFWTLIVFIKILDILLAQRYIYTRGERRSLFKEIGDCKYILFRHSANADPEEINCFNLCFIPRREIRSISSRGPIEVSFHLLNFGLERVYWTSKTYRVYRVFFARKCFIVTGWTGGRVGRVGRLTKRSFNFFHFEIY